MTVLRRRQPGPAMGQRLHEPRPILGWRHYILRHYTRLAHRPPCTAPGLRVASPLDASPLALSSDRRAVRPAVLPKHTGAARISEGHPATHQKNRMQTPSRRRTQEPDCYFFAGSQRQNPHAPRIIPRSGRFPFTTRRVLGNGPKVSEFKVFYRER